MGSWNKLKTAVDQFAADHGELLKTPEGKMEKQHFIVSRRLEIERRILNLQALTEIAGSLDSIAADLKALNNLQQRLGAKAESTMDRIRPTFAVKERRRRK